MQDIHEKLDIRNRALEASALKRTSFVGSEVGDGKIGDDPAAVVSHLSPFLKGAEAFLKGAEADNVLPATLMYALPFPSLSTVIKSWTLSHLLL